MIQFLRFALIFSMFVLAPVRASDSAAPAKGRCEQWLHSQSVIEAFQELFAKEGTSPAELDAIILRLLPPGGQSLSNAEEIKAWALQHSARSLARPVEELALARPPTLGTTQSEIFMIREAQNAEASQAPALAAIKIFGKNTPEFFREILGLTHLKQHPILGLRPVAIYEMGTVRVDGMVRPYLLMEAAPGLELEEIMRREAQALATLSQEQQKTALARGAKRDAGPRTAPFRSRRRHTSHQQPSGSDAAEALQLVYTMHQAVARTGKALAAMHHQFQQNVTSAALQSAIDERRRYDIARASSFLETLRTSAAESRWASREELSLLEQGIKPAMERLRQTQEPLTQAHGDAHQGNFIFNLFTETVYVIDTERHLYSMDPANGPTEAGTDLGRLYEAIEVDGLRFGLPEREIRSLQRELLRAYGSTSGLPASILLQRIEVFRLRLDAIALQDLAARKYDSSTRCELLHRVLIRYGIRQVASASPCGDEPLYDRVRKALGAKHGHAAPRPVFVDLDRTMGFYNDLNHSWIIYNGALEALQALAAEAPLILFTANTKSHVDRFFESFPALIPLFKTVVTGEEFAPHMTTLASAMTQGIRQGSLPAETNFINYIYSRWQQDPASVFPRRRIPAELDLAVPQALPFESWIEQVYKPFISPDKARLVDRLNGILIDDEFSANHALGLPSSIYGNMVDDGRAIYAGARGTARADDGPDWNQIRHLVQERLAAVDL